MTSSTNARPSTDDATLLHADGDLRVVRRKASRRRFLPLGTVRCIGMPIFRSALARDLALLLDLDEEVDAWRCLPELVEFADGDGVVFGRVPDFSVRYSCGSEAFMDAGAFEMRPVDNRIAWSAVCEAEIRTEPAISNARDMLRYAPLSVSAGDRIRLMAYLDETGTTTLVEAASGMRETVEPVGAVIALALHRVVRIDWREKRLAPDSCVELIR